MSKCQGVKRATSAQLKLSNFIQTYDFQAGFISDLKNVIDFEVIKGSNLHLGVDPLGGAGVYYWAAIAEKYGINLTVVRSEVDKTFRFMTLDWDGKIRMDPSSKYAMQSLIDLKDDFDIAFAADTDHDRHGIVTRSSGLMPSNDYLAVMAYYLLTNRTSWPDSCAVAKTVVSTSLINKVAKGLNKKVFEFPVGFKWFAQGLKTAEFNFAGEESAGASFSRLDGTVWTTDKDGITAGLLAGEIMARTGKDPAQIYQTLLTNYGAVFSGRLDAPISFKQKKILKQLDETKISINHLAGDKITAVMTKAPANGEPIGGIKIVSEGGWFAARPSGTENIYKIYTESFKSLDHLVEIQQEAQKIVQEIIEPKK